MKRAPSPTLPLNPSLHEYDFVTLREDISREVAWLPISSLRRFGRLAVSLARGLRLARREREPIGREEVTALVLGLGQLKGVAMKAGQILSYVDVGLPEDLRGALAILQRHSPSMPFEAVSDILSSDLGPRSADLLGGMDRVPVATASIGQVHRSRLPDGTPVAVKVRFPGIEAAIAADFRPAAVATRLVTLLYPGADVGAFVREARDRFLGECDYVREADSQELFRTLYERHPVIEIPATHRSYCGPRVLVSNWIDGWTMEEILRDDPPAAERDRLGRALFEFYLGTLFRHGLYNCDPHPGNHLYLSGGRIAILDHGCTRSFEPGFVAALARLTRAVHADRDEDLEQAFGAIGLLEEGKTGDLETIRALVRSFYGPLLLDEVAAIDPHRVIRLEELVARKRQLLRVRLPGEILFLFRIRFGLLSVLARLGARANWHRIERDYLDEAMTIRPLARSEAS